MLKSLTASAALSLAVMAPGFTAQAQDPTGPALVDLLLNAVAEEFGLTLQSKAAGSLRQGATATATLQIAGGGAAIIGVCDENCSDVDMIVRDPSGREVGRDFEDDDTPLVFLETTTAGRYTVEMQMPGCNGTCNWGAAAYN
jgi:hypothetical protein